jgi:hypothetical protein
MKTIRNGSQWGDWTLEVDKCGTFLVLDTKEERHHYEINLDSIDGSAEMLDWIFQMRMKAWVTNNIMGDLLSAFQDIFRPQATLCGQGIDKKLDAERFLKSRIKAAA